MLKVKQLGSGRGGHENQGSKSPKYQLLPTDLCSKEEEHCLDPGYLRAVKRQHIFILFCVTICTLQHLTIKYNLLLYK